MNISRVAAAGRHADHASSHGTEIHIRGSLHVVIASMMASIAAHATVI